MTKILLDFSQTVISSVVVHMKDIKTGDTKNLIKHIALNSILAAKKKFKGDIIICCDSRNYWRKNEFPSYKGHRKAKKESSDIDWDLVYETLTELKQELRDNFPYIVLEVNMAEADDIIATMCKYYSENEFTNIGLIEEPREVIIISTDNDFLQLQKYKNVSQYSLVQKKELICNNPIKALNEKIAVGDAGDNIPSVVNGDSWSSDRANGIPNRAKPLKTAKLDKFTLLGIDACETEEERRNYKRNELLIDLSKIPSNISDAILSEYNNYQRVKSPKKVYDYLLQRDMRMLLSEVQSF